MKRLFPLFVFVRSGFEAFSLKRLNHTVESATPHLFKPFGMTEPFYKGGTNCIVGFDKYSAIPRFCKSIVTRTAKSPNLGAIIRTVNSSSNVTTAGVILYGNRRRGVVNKSNAIKIGIVWSYILYFLKM